VATSRLKIYNGALLICQQRSLASLTVNEEARHALDEVWNDGGVRFCLEQAQWRFAMRAARLDYEPSLAPDWGYRRAFTKPTDWIATSAVCTDEFFNTPLTQYADEVGYWFADMDEIYVKFVSDHANYGGDLSRWTATFTEYVKHHFASKVAPRLPGARELAAGIVKLTDKALLTAKNKDAMAGPTTFPARGSWLAARFGRSSGRRDGGSRTGNLIG
jgi:hypothetical protein